MQRATALIVLGLALACSPQSQDEGGETDVAVEPRTAPAEPASESSPDEGRSAATTVSTIPDPCEIVTVDRATEILGAPAVRSEPLPCAYDTEDKSRQITASIYSPAARGLSYEGLSGDALVEQLRLSMMGEELEAVKEEIGDGAYFLSQGSDSIVVHVDTGVSGPDQGGNVNELAIQAGAFRFPSKAGAMNAAETLARLLMDELEP